MGYQEWRAKRRLAKRESMLQLYATSLATSFILMSFHRSVELWKERLDSSEPHRNQTYVMSYEVFPSIKDVSQEEYTRLSELLLERLRTRGARSIDIERREDKSLWFHVTFGLTRWS